MNELVTGALMNGLLVGMGLYVLWTVTKWVPPRGRALYAAIAGGFSVAVSLIVSMLIVA